MKLNYNRITAFVTIISITCFLLLPQNNLFADSNIEEVEIYLKNGDKVSGKLVSENQSQITIENQILGTVSIKKEFVDKIVNDEEVKVAKIQEHKSKLWQREISMGLNKSSGNTENTHLSSSLYVNRKTDANEFTIKGDIFYSSANKTMDAQKWYSMIRYAYSFSERKWYNFYKLESDHDRFANIDYRIIPSLGIGYWFSDIPDWKAITEVGIGLEHANFKDDTKDSNEAVLIPRAFFEKKLFGKSRISQDIIFYPSLTESGEYRFYSETAFINPINEKLSLRFSFIDDYNSKSTKDTKKNDARLISSLSYSF
ncbi:MAG: DUF481 domain-containing protein [Candidatus Omnitrophota bacterium]|nr:DUF481 domain-containing protein [Candidatus Omnitrophota bacterium]MBU2035343.1 DUF481 domain-containing protein [Candidatus Omnitrophota bacterium]